MSNLNHNRAVAVAQAEDTFDLLQHIAWSGVIKPKFDEQITTYSKMLVNDALGIAPLPKGLTREQIAGRAYGLTYTISLLESILTRGEKALEELNGHRVLPSSLPSL